MANTKTKEQEGADLLEGQEMISGKAEAFLNDKKNQNIVFGVGGLLAVVILGFLGFKYYNGKQNTEAQEELFQAVYYFEADSLDKALNGDGISLGFLDVINNYSGTKAGNLAKFYAGAAYLQQGSYSSAALQFEDFSSDDLLLQARAYSLAGDAYAELKEIGKAISFYEKAANYKENAEFTPLYLTKLAIAYEADGEFSKAADAYAEIVDKYAKSTLAQDAKKHKARLQGLAAE